MATAVMVSQSQEHEWANNPSRTGSMLSLDGRQRPATVKTPPSYYDAVRSRHSLSQPVNKSPEKQDKNLHVQQVKYNSLPRPLPQRYPPAAKNHQQTRSAWTEDPLNHNGNSSNHCGMRQQYDSPPKPANRVPLQLQVHQDRGSMKRGTSDQPESFHQGYVPAPRGMEHLRNNVPRQGVERVDGNSRPVSMDVSRKESMLSMPMRVDNRPPPPIPGRRPPPPQSRATVPNGVDGVPLSPLKRDVNQNPSSGGRFPMPVHGSHTLPNGYTPASRTVVTGTSSYEPRYSKSGKLCHRMPTQDPKPMPPPVVMLRTGPLGSYPDPETLKKCDMASFNHRPERSYSTGDFDAHYHRSSTDLNNSQKSYENIHAFTNGNGDHLSSSYCRSPVSPHEKRSVFDDSQMFDRKISRKDAHNNLQQSPSLSHLPNSSSSNLSTPIKSHTLPPNGRVPNDCFNPIREYMNRTQQQNNLMMQQRTESTSSLNSQFNQIPSDNRMYHPSDNNNAIYANHEVSARTANGGRIEHPYEYQRSRSNSTSGPLYENSSSLHSSPRENFRGIQEVFPESVYANYNVETHYNNGHPGPNFKQQECQQKPVSLENSQHVLQVKGPVRQQQFDQKTHPPPVAQKPNNVCQPPSEMLETRGWNGQSHINSYGKEVVKPTPRLPRFANGLIATSAQLTTVPAYQCVINELSTRPHTSPTATDSSTLSFKSSCDSSSSSSREFSRRPCKSDSSMEQSRSVEGGVRSANSYRQIDKSLLSASMTSLCSETSSSLSSRRRHFNEDSSRERLNEEFQQRKEKGSVFSASPWEREAKEKLQKEQVLDARKARDQEIAYLESLEERSEKQEEWLRILRLEREFQRRAEQELDDDDDEGSVCSETTDSDKTESFHGDKLTVIPNERLGLKLLDELLDPPPKSSEKATNKRELPLGNPSERHFIPLDVAIPDNDLQSPSLPLTNNILKISSEQNSAPSGNRLSKPPVPAPRPSKNFTPIPSSDNPESASAFEPIQKAVSNENISSSLAKLEISDSCAYFCSTENDLDNSVNESQNNWLIEVPNDVPLIREESSSTQPKPKQNGFESKNGPEQSRIYENIKPADYQCLKTQHSSSGSSYSSHTLPKSSSSGMSALKETTQLRSGSRFAERKFPTMGISSTLSKKSNGYSTCDADILPALYASCKTRSEVVKDVPPDLADKSPEFKKMWISRPEKLTFQDKIKKFSIQAGDGDAPRDRIKNSKAQREIENRFSEVHKRASAT